MEAEQDLVAKLHGMTDGSVWAKEFCKIAKEKGLDIDEGWMIGWFANAIEIGKADGRKAGYDTAEKIVLKEMLASMKEASERRYQTMKKIEAEAETWKREGDMYGWNFHIGRAGGCNESDLCYYRVTVGIQNRLKVIDG